MSSTTTVTTWADLYGALIGDMRTNTGLTATVEKAKRFIDEGHHWIYNTHGTKFHWAERRAFIKTHAEYSDGTIAATIGSATLTGTDTLWNTNNDHGQPNARAGGRIVIGGGTTIYNVLTVPSDTSMTISPEYIGDTDTELDYRYFEDAYALASDFRNPKDKQSFNDARTIHLIGGSDFRKRFPRNWMPTTSIRNAIIQDEAPSGNTTPIRKVRFGPPPSDTQIIPYTYVTTNIVVASDGTPKASFTADTDEPTMPLSHRPLILVAAKAVWYRDVKDDQRSTSCFQEFSSRLDDLVGDQDVGAQTLRMVSPRAWYAARAKRPYVGRGGRYDTNGRFDRFEND